MAKAGCYKFKLIRSLNMECQWIRKHKTHLCSVPKTCIAKALHKAGCYVFRKSAALAK
jgi:hypothetical protein